MHQYNNAAHKSLVKYTQYTETEGRKHTDDNNEKNMDNNIDHIHATIIQKGCFSFILSVSFQWFSSESMLRQIESNHCFNFVL
jgi:hypothetical protein